jgi:hypothetical protein
VTVLNPEKCKLDIKYIETTGFLTDLKILMHTVLKLSNRSRRTFSTDAVRFLQTRTSMEMNSSKALNEVENADFAGHKVRQSA